MVMFFICDIPLLSLPSWSYVLTGISGSLNFDEEDTEEEEETEKKSGSHSPYSESERPSSATSQKSATVSVMTSVCNEDQVCAF